MDGGHIRPIKMDPHIGSLWRIATCLGIVMISCYISGVACDVPDDVVYTDLHKTVRIGDSVVLKCQFRGTPLAVYWKKGGDPERSPTLISWITGDPVTGSCVHEKVCRIMEMNAEFSLIINEISIAEQGQYVCTVANYKGSKIHNFTDISVFSPPKEPYPIINECQMISPTDTETTCTISTSHSVKISCSASGYFPDIDLYFIHGSTSLPTKKTIEVTNLDGTKNKTIYANATASEISYVCFASIPGSQQQRTTTVLVNLPTSSSPMLTGPTVPIDRRDGSVAQVVGFVIFWILWPGISIALLILLHRMIRQKRQGFLQKKYKLTDRVFEEFALNITKRHCQRLGKIFNLPESAIAKMNEEDLQVFRTDKMLKFWFVNQNCSNYEIRRRLRQAAKQCNRQDIADNFISKEQSEVIYMPSTMKLPACLTITNEEQSPGARASENDPSISLDELDRIGRYAGSAVLLAFCKRYGVTVPGQQSPDGKELLSKIISVLKPTLDSEFESGNEPNTPRKTLRQLLENEQPRYACLLAKKKTFNIFNVELIDLTIRLIMADVYPFAKALNISDHFLNFYKASNIGPHKMTQGTAYILKQATANIEKQVSIDNRVKMVTPLGQAGYSEEARALYFGFDISIGDVIEVENQVDMAQLAKELGISVGVQSTSRGNQGKSVLHRWRDTVRSSTFNHRLVLADALFRMEEEQLALNIISGVYRNGEIDEQVAERLAANILAGQLTTLNKILDQTEKELKRKGPAEISNELLDAGFYRHAHEYMYMAVFHHGTDTGNVATKELRQGSIAINKPGTQKGLEQVAKDTIPTEGMQETNTTEEGKGGSQNSEDKKSLVKEATDTNNVIAEISREEKNPSLTNEEEVMQEKSRDGAAESKENITENVDTKEQGNTPDVSDECQQDESSKLLTQAGT